MIHPMKVLASLRVRTGTPEMTVWDNLVGQARAVEAMQAAAAGRGMSHAWLFTGPPGSGRSNAAVALAAALQCERGGCDECHECHTVQAGTHADVTVVRTEKLSIGVDEVRDLVRRSALSPVGRRWQIMIVEDADRLTDQACNALLKAIEEPTERTVWMLCAPTVEDVLPTIRSRCRLVTLATPTADDVAAFLVRQGRRRRRPRRLRRPRQPGPHRSGAGAGPRRGHPQPATRGRHHPGPAHLARRLHGRGRQPRRGDQGGGRPDHLAARRAREGRPRRRPTAWSSAAAVPASTRLRSPLSSARQKTRAKRRQLDVVDRGLMDLVSVYRDAIAEATGAGGPLVNEEIRGDVAEVVRASTPELNLRRIGWIFEAREQMLEFNVPVPLALESMMLALKVPEGSR